MTNTQHIGKPHSRVDGHKKVTGQATYAAEFQLENLGYGYVVQSTVASGTITTINTDAASALPGVIQVFTHQNLPEYLKIKPNFSDPLAPPGQPFRPLYNGEILYNGQPIALVVADTFEIARYAAGLVETSYDIKPYSTDIRDNLHLATREDLSDPPADRGDAEAAFAQATHQVAQEYFLPRHYHNPMEPHATIADWNEEEKSFLVYDKIQGVNNSQKYICHVFGLDKEKVRVLAPFVGGGFGSGLRPQYQLFMATMASRALRQPVRVVLTRAQMFSFGHRPSNLQRIKLSADASGKLTSIDHRSFGETSKFEKFSESVVGFTGVVYPCGNVKHDYQLVPVNAYTSMDMRGPGGTTGMYALEIAMDEMAEEVGIDPLEFRLKNYAEKDHNEDKPFSSKELRACFAQAADRIGWQNRSAQPRSQQEGNQLVGYGMAIGIWEADQKNASAKASLDRNGHLIVSSSTADIGTGTYTVMTQIAAETMGLPMDKVSFKLGDTDLPQAPIEGGSYTVSSVGSAVKQVCKKLRMELAELLEKKYPKQFKGAKAEHLSLEGNVLKFKDASIALTELLADAEGGALSITTRSKEAESRKDYSCYAHSCVMVKVAVDKDLGMIQVQHMVSAVAGGRIINPKTAENQILGGMTWGIGMALEEEGMMDDKLGRIMNANLAEYHVAIQADVQKHEVIFVEEHDEIVNPLGAKGLGEIGLVGVAAAIANAVYNATGKRVRELPITLDKMM